MNLLLSGSAIDDWQKLARQTMKELNVIGPIITPDEVGHETAEKQADGWLVLTGRIRDNEIRMLVAPGQWRMENGGLIA